MKKTLFTLAILTMTANSAFAFKNGPEHHTPGENAPQDSNDPSADNE